MRRSVVLFLGALLLLRGGSSLASPLALRPEGQPPLLLDYGRPLEDYLRVHGLGKVRRPPRRGTPHWLNAVEKARLDARRIWSAPRLSVDEKLERLVAVVQHRIPDAETSDASHQRLTRHELCGEGFARLSRRTACKVGQSFDRAWLMRGLLDEIGVQSTVRTGRVFDVMDRPRGGHAWLELSVGGRPLLLDPSSRQPLPEFRPMTLPERTANGTLRSIRCLETLAGWLYVPDDVSRPCPARR